MLEAFSSTGLVYAMVSEEIEDLTELVGGEDSQYILCCDPCGPGLQIPISTARWARFSACGVVSLAQRCLRTRLRKGSDQILAGYVMYSTSTLLVFATAHGVHGFTLDRELGEFLLSHENIRCPKRGHYYSANLGHSHEWTVGVRNYLQWVTAVDKENHKPYSLRYNRRSGGGSTSGPG